MFIQNDTLWVYQVIGIKKQSRQKRKYLDPEKRIYKKKNDESDTSKNDIKQSSHLVLFQKVMEIPF